MKKSLLDLKLSGDGRVNRETLDEYTKILENPDLLSRLFRLFVFKHTRRHLWKDLLGDYIERNVDRDPKWVNDIRTNLTRTLFTNTPVTWKKFLEGLVVLSPAFDTMELCVYSSLNNGKKTILKIRESTLEWDDAIIDPIPKGDRLVPYRFHRSPLEPLPLKVVRDALGDIGTSSEFREIVRSNLKDIVVSTKLNSSVNSLYVSVLKPTMSWTRMSAILFALGASQMMVEIHAIKRGVSYKSIVEVSR